MQHQTGTLITGDGARLFTQQWFADRPLAIVVLSHGYAEHSLRYEHFARFLAEHSLTVYAIDHRGHGKSEGDRANINVFHEYVADLGRYIECIRDEHGSLPKFLLGHSVGGAIATKFVLENPHKVNGLILSGAFLRNAVKVSPVLQALSGLLSRYFPSLPTIRVNADLLSHDREIVHHYKADPLVYSGGTKARIGYEITRIGPYLLKRAESIKLPVLIMHGTDDQIASPEGSSELYKGLSSKDSELKLYEGFFHEILNELDKEIVYQDILDWITQRLS